MNAIHVFKNPQFGEIHTITIDGEPWLVGKEVAEALGYRNASKALSDHVDAEDKLYNESLSSLGQRGGWLINESGLYSLVMSSKLPDAKKFRRWVTSEVLPSIRKSGGYIARQESMSDTELLAKAALVAQKIIESRDARIRELETQRKADAPKVIFADAVSASGNSILIGELAKLLKQNGAENMGQNRLFAWLRSNGYLIRRKGTDYNMPTQRSMEMGLFRVKETAVTHSDGHVTVNKTPKVTGKGQTYFINLFLEERK